MMFDIFESLKLWRDERMIGDIPYNHMDLIGYLTEEITEGIRDKSEHESVDWRVDCLIFLINSLEQDNYDAKLCIDEAIEEISSRKGNYIPSVGKWLKNVDQDPSTIYKADYTNCKRA